MDKRKGNGGARDNAGRKPKSHEQGLIQKLTPLQPAAFKALKEAISMGEPWAVKLFFDYKFGKAKETKDITVFQEQPIFNFDLDDND